VSGRTLVVLDASVGVKWFRDEEGSSEANLLLVAQSKGSIDLHVSEHFVVETLSVINRSFGPLAIIPAGDALTMAEIEVHPLTPELVGETARQCALLGCTFYDALAPALAILLSAELWSADRRAHSAVPDVRLIGG